MNLLSETILITVSLHGRIDPDKLIDLATSHGFDKIEALDALKDLIKSRTVTVGSDFMIEHVESIREEIPQYSLDAADNYRKSQRLNFINEATFKFGFHIIFIVAVVLTLLICLASVGKAQEMPAWTTVEITAYCPCVICCGDHADGKTANMTSVLAVPYNLAADRSLPMGTKIYIPLGFGVLDNVRKSDRYFSIDDRGGALDTESKKYKIIRLDLRVKEHSWAVKFGRKRIPVIINNVKDAGEK